MYAGNTSAFLQLLALGTALPMILGYFFVRPIPLPSEPSHGIERGLIANDAAADTSALMDDSRTRLLDYDESDVDFSDPDGQPYSRTHENTRSRSSSVNDTGAASTYPHGHLDDNLPNIFGAELWKNGDFWLLFTILSICTCHFSCVFFGSLFQFN